MRNVAILTLSVLAFFSLAALGGRFQSTQNFTTSQLASPYASGRHLTVRTSDNTVQLSGDYLWRFVYAWDGTKWEQRDLAQLLNLTRDNVAGSLSQADNRFIIAGAGSPVSVALVQLGVTPPPYLAFWSANFANNRWCGGCDEAGNRGRWQIVRTADVTQAAPAFTQSAKLQPLGDATSHTLLAGDTFIDEGSRITLPTNNTTLRWVVHDSALSSHFIAVGNDGRWTNWLALAATAQSDPAASVQRITLPLNNIPAGTYQIAVASCVDNATPERGNCTVLQQRNTTAPTIVVQSATVKQQAAVSTPVPPAFTVITDQTHSPDRSFFALGKHATGNEAALRNDTTVFHTILNDPNPGHIDHFEVSLDGQTWTPFRLGNRSGDGPALPECRISTYPIFGALDRRSPNPCYEWSVDWPNGRPLHERVTGIFGTSLESAPGFHRLTRRMSVYIPTASLASPTGFASYNIALRSCNASGCSAGRAFPSFSILSDQTEPILIVDPIEVFTSTASVQAVPTVTRTANLPPITLPVANSTIATGPCTIFTGYDSCPARITWSTPQSTARLFVKRPSQSEPQLAAQGPGGTQPFTGDQVFEVSAHRTTLPFGILTIVTDEPVFTLAAPSGAQLANGEVNVSYSNDLPQPFINCLPLPASLTDQWQEGYNNGLPFCPEGVTAPDDGTALQASAASVVGKKQAAAQIPQNASFEACGGSLRCGILRVFGGDEQTGALPRGLLPYNQRLWFVGDRQFTDQHAYEDNLTALSQLQKSFEFLRRVPDTPGFSDTQIFVPLNIRDGRRALEEHFRDAVEILFQRSVARGDTQIRSADRDLIAFALDEMAKYGALTMKGGITPAPLIYLPTYQVFQDNSLHNIDITLVHEMAHVLDISNRATAEFKYSVSGYEALFSEPDMLYKPDATDEAQRAANTVYVLSQLYTAAESFRARMLTVTVMEGRESFSTNRAGTLFGFSEGSAGMGTHINRARYGSENIMESSAVTAEELYAHPSASIYRIPTPIGIMREHFVAKLFGGPLADYDVLSSTYQGFENQAYPGLSEDPELVSLLRTVRERIRTGSGMSSGELVRLQADYTTRMLGRMQTEESPLLSLFSDRVLVDYDEFRSGFEGGDPNFYDFGGNPFPVSPRPIPSSNSFGRTDPFGNMSGFTALPAPAPSEPTPGSPASYGYLGFPGGQGLLPYAGDTSVSDPGPGFYGCIRTQNASCP